MDGRRNVCFINEIPQYLASFVWAHMRSIHYCYTSSFARIVHFAWMWIMCVQHLRDSLGCAQFCLGPLRPMVRPENANDLMRNLQVIKMQADMSRSRSRQFSESAICLSPLKLFARRSFVSRCIYFCFLRWRGRPTYPDLCAVACWCRQRSCVTMTRSDIHHMCKIDVRVLVWAQCF